MGVFLLLQTSFTAMFPTLSLSLVGAFLAHMKLLDKNTNTMLSHSVANFFAPVINFVYISASINLNELETIWPLIVLPPLLNLTFFMLSYLITALAGYPKSMRNTFTMFLSLNNFGLVFTLSKGICSPYGPLGDDENCPDAFSYISIYTITQTFIYWSVGYSIVGRDKKFAKVDNDEEILESPSVKETTLCKTILKNLISPNPISCFLGIIFAFIPGYKELFFHSDSPLLSVAKIYKDIGFLCIFLAQLVLGSNIYMMFGVSSFLTRKLLIITVIIKTLIVPSIALVIVYFLWAAGIFGNNRLMAYVIFIANACPPPILVMIFTVMYKINVNEVVQASFWSNITNIFTLVFWTFIFFNLVKLS